MNDDGTMARLPDLVKFAQSHGLKVGTIADLIAYRRRFDHIVQRVAEGPFESRNGGQFRAIAYVNTIENSEHLALVKGDVSGPESVLVRVQTLNIYDDVLDSRQGPGDAVAESMRLIGQAGRGVFVLIRQKNMPSIASYLTGTTPSDDHNLRETGIGAQILLDLGVQNMILLTNSPERRVVALDGYGLKIVETRAIQKKAKAP
jgi:3,4-dihydroxy 2-butanone 4-phosphate synthase/GTP cyclohydrolase II